MKLIYAFVFLILTFSCAKDDGGFLGLGEGGATSFEGKVTEKGSGKAVPYAQVNLQSLPEGAGMAIYRTDTAVYADENGNFSFSYIADRTRDYHLLPRHELYDNRQNKQEIRSGRRNKIDLELDPWAWVRVHIINEPPLDTVDYISFNTFHNTIPLISGFYKDTIVVGTATGNVNHEIILFWKKINYLNGEQQMIREYIYCPGMDTVDYYFKF